MQTLGQDAPSASDSSFEIWQAMADGWSKTCDQAWRAGLDVARWLIAGVSPQTGETILELAAGRGQVGFLAAEMIGPSGTLICSDLSPRMLAVARRNGQRLALDNVEYRLIDAQQIALPSRHVDAIVCRWGYMLMADPGAALVEARRVLKPGGRLALAVWGAQSANPWASMLERALEELGCPVPPSPARPGVFALARADTVARHLESAGFRELGAVELDCSWSVPAFDDYWRFATERSGAHALTIAALPAADRARLKSVLRGLARPYRRQGAYTFPGLSLGFVAS